MTAIEIQLGKQGLTENFILALENHFKKCSQVRISILKSAGHDKKEIKKYSDLILEKLGKNYTAKLIGFKIILKKWRREMR